MPNDIIPNQTLNKTKKPKPFNNADYSPGAHKSYLEEMLQTDVLAAAEGAQIAYLLWQAGVGGYKLNYHSPCWSFASLPEIQIQDSIICGVLGGMVGVRLRHCS